MIVNKKQLSDIVGISERSLTDWQKEGLPIQYEGERGEANQYDTTQVIAWMIAREIAKQVTETQKDRLARLQGDKLVLDIAREKRILIPVDQIEPTWLTMVSSARAHLLAAPDKLAHLLEATEGIDAKRDLLAETFEEFLRKLSTYEPAESIDEAGMPAFCAAAENVSGAVGGNLPLPV